MAENGLRETVLGVTFDGTGYGTDGAIWGGEFLVAGYSGFQRRAHIRYVPLAGGDAAVREPWRSALAWCGDSLEALPGVPAEKFRVVRRMIETGTNTVPTSSCGRLFDAAAALLGIRNQVTFEGQAAIELEMTCADSAHGPYPFEIVAGDPWQIDFRPALQCLLRSTEDRPIAAARFHASVAHAIAAVCRQIRAECSLHRVCLSGGTFQNVKLLSLTLPLLRDAGFEVYLHEKVPPNDGGIALGQAAIAAARLDAAGNAW
jgi:hydrogenase maturation protein HypF